MATTTERPTSREQVSRDEMASRLLEVLTDEPVSVRALARRLEVFAPGVDESGARNVQVSLLKESLKVLEARHQAMRVPHSAGTRHGGWALYDEDRVELQEKVDTDPGHLEFPYEWAKVSLDMMFVDPDYQRPLTSFAERIRKRFDPVLFQVLVLSDRLDSEWEFNERGVIVPTKGRKKHRFALIDGQTRWHAATRLSVPSGPSIIFSDLTPEDEASLFWRFQKERRGMMSWHRFRAQLASKDEESLRILALVNTVGFELGEGPGQMRAVAALESCFRTDEFQLERALSDFREAWPKIVPEGRFIRGLHFFLRHYPVDDPTKVREIDDEKLVRRLSVSGPDGLLKKQMAAREIIKGTPEKLMAMAIQAAYHSTAKS